MKKSCFIIIAVIVFSTTANAQEKTRRWFLDAGLNLVFVSGETFGGGAVEVGFHIKPKHLVTFEFGGAVGGSEEIGTYSYYITYSDGTTKYYNDGEITRDLSTSSSFFTYYFLTGNYESKWRGRFGASLGLRTITAKNDYSPTYKDGAKIEGLPGDMKDKDTQAAGALNAGLTWNFSKRFFADALYRLAFSGASDIDNEEYGNITNQVRLSVGWRF